MTRATRLIVVLTIAGLLAAPAAAQQGWAPPPVVDDYYVPPWQGLYVGGHLGFGQVDPADGFLGGAQAGYNWQSGRIVYGLEADVTWSDISGDETVSDCARGRACVSARVETSIDWMATLRGRVGYLVQPDLLPYVTAGFGLVSSSVSASVRVSDFSLSPIDDDDTEADFVYGIGLEGRIGPASLLRIEYLGFNDNEIDVIRAGLSFKLGGSY